MCFCPAISSRVWGRIRAASGSPEWLDIILDGLSSGVKSESMGEFYVDVAREATENFQ